ncbi:hypothetical protein N0V90_000824 [Kalmusia sp. IMI 367209]|nr:hypothetical protein N0V90_000824 [Kalmusia sp. IMI 367209]
MSPKRKMPVTNLMHHSPHKAKLRYDRNPSAGQQRFDISPPSSPEPDQHQQEIAGQPRRFRSMRDVSPVDENRGRSAVSPRGTSNIPVLRKAPPSLRNQDSQDLTATQKFWGGKVAPNSKVRWDEYSGEPTSSNAGKASQVSPGSYQTGGSPPSARLRETGYDATIVAQHGTSRRNQSLAERANRYGTKPVPVDTRPREPWSKATGRAEIVKPFRDQPSDKPSNLRKADTMRAGEFEKNASNSLTANTARVPVRADTAPVADTPAPYDTHEEPIKPIVPLKVARTSPPRELASPTSPHSPGISNPYTYSPITPTNKQFSAVPVNDHNPAIAEPAQPQPTTPTAKVPRKSIEDTPGSTASKDNGPASRFSWTTYNSGTTYQHSPPPSPPPPLPTSKVPTEPISAASAILNRKRPVAVADRVPARKPIPSSTASTARNTMISDPPSPRPDSTFSTSTHKALPRPPTEHAAADHIEILESQMEDLKVRRNNVYRLLNDLNNMAPPNPMVTDFKRMRLVDQRKKDFEDELAEIKREEHDVGLKLHRAWRKRETADPGSESALWIRRVTR